MDFTYIESNIDFVILNLLVSSTNADDGFDGHSPDPPRQTFGISVTILVMAILSRWIILATLK